MRPNWLTISILPALIAAFVSVSATEIVLHTATKPVGEQTATGNSVNKQQASPNDGSQAASVKQTISPGRADALGMEAKHITSGGGDSERKDAGPWWATLAASVMWPISLLLALAFIAYNARLGRLLGFGTRLVKKISAGGLEIEINSETVELVQRQLHDTFQDLIKGAGDEYDRMAQIQDIPELLKNAINVIVPREVDGLRGTIHVNDVIFPDYLYQLVDYHPAGGGSDRRFSLRFGIIGRTWRSKKSHGTGNAFDGAGGSVDALVENWGMTEQEANGQVNGRPSCLSVLVRCQSVSVGVLFIDSTKRDAFGDDETALALAKRAEALPEVSALGEALSRTLAPLRTAAPSLKIRGPAK